MENRLLVDFTPLKQEAQKLGKESWRPMLAYLAELHERAIMPPEYPFPHAWEEIGPGYHLRPAFGHWDIVHQILDSLPQMPQHALLQLQNNLAAQQEDGLVPGTIMFIDDKPRWGTDCGHPPVWPVAVQDYLDLAGRERTREFFTALVRQIDWFENNRKASGGGYFYLDILTRRWESGVDDGVRFDKAPEEKLACIDATCHVFWLYRHARDWAKDLGEDPGPYALALERIGGFIKQELYDAKSGYFHDAWSVREPDGRHIAFEGMWPMVVGAATRDQATHLIDEYLINPRHFFTDHPMATVSRQDPLFELKLWRGPAWNSMTYWFARGCLENERPDAARLLLAGALDATATQFARTGAIWEYYHPFLGQQDELERKPYTDQNVPCQDYLGHNPLFAMARLWEKAGGQE